MLIIVLCVCNCKTSSREDGHTQELFKAGAEIVVALHMLF